jgi:adenylate cyclase
MSADTAPVHVLLVDDQRIVGEAVRRLLSAEPRIVLHVEQDPRRALARAVEVQATVILQDLIMPEVDGLDLVLEYRQSPPTAEVPLVVLSSREDPVVKAEAFARGANDYLVKLPAGPELVARVLYHSRALRDHRERDAAFAALELSKQQLAKSNELILRLFGRYVDDDVVSRILEDPDGITVDGERRDLSVMMADMRGFTRVSDSLAPEQVIRLLNNYTRPMIDTIAAWGGTLDNIIGDGLFILFGAPTSMPDHARRAVGCALAMQRAMDEVNRRNAADGLPRVEMGIGIHSGEVVAGNIGSEIRAKYSVVGSNVNLAARIQGFTSGGQVFVSEQTCRRAGADVRVRSSFEVQPKSFRGVFRVIEVAGMGDEPDLEAMAPPESVVPVDPPLPVVLQMYEDKVASGEPLPAQIDGRHGRDLMVRSGQRLPVGKEVRVERPEAGDGVWSLFALVVSSDDTTGALVLRWTDGSVAARRWLDS